MFKKFNFLIILATSLVSLFSFSANAKGKLTLYCSVEIDVCEILVQAFEKEIEPVQPFAN